MPETSLLEAELWQDTIHQIEDGDPVNGGVPDRASRSGGPNIAAKGLADRTRWLRARVLELTQALTPAEILRALLPVDGTGSGLDADLLDGRHASAFVLASREGAGNGLNADMVDGRHAAEFILASREGPGGGLDADLLDGRHAREIGSTAGDIKAVLAATAPEGWLVCNGAELARADFPELWDRSGTWLRPGGSDGTFLLPDLRGEFLRGWDGGRGIDAGRVLGAAQHGSHAAHDIDGQEVHAWSDRAAALAMGMEAPEIATQAYQTYAAKVAVSPALASNGYYSAIRVRNVAVTFVIKF